MMDYFENYEIDDNDVRMKIFVQSLTGDVRTWLRHLLQTQSLIQMPFTKPF